MDDLADKVAFVTGAGSGIGLEIARALAKRGAKVMLADVDTGSLKSAVGELQTIHPNIDSVLCDVSDPEAVRAAADAVLTKFKKIHIVVNNAGVALAGATGHVPLQDWRWIVDINLLGVAHGVEIYVPLMRAQGEGGHIINTASIAGHLAGAEMGPYTATKFAVVGLSEVMRQDLAKDGIGVSVLCPAWVKTNIAETASARPSRWDADVPQLASQSAQQIATSVQTGINPADVGEWTVECILANRFYIFTHPSLKPFLDARAEEIQSDLAACAADPRFEGA